MHMRPVIVQVIQFLLDAPLSQSLFEPSHFLDLCLDELIEPVHKSRHTQHQCGSEYSQVLAQFDYIALVEPILDHIGHACQHQQALKHMRQWQIRYVHIVFVKAECAVELRQTRYVSHEVAVGQHHSLGKVCGA